MTGPLPSHMSDRFPPGAAFYRYMIIYAAWALTIESGDGRPHPSGTEPVIP